MKNNYHVYKVSFYKKQKDEMTSNATSIQVFACTLSFFSITLKLILFLSIYNILQLDLSTTKPTSLIT